MTLPLFNQIGMITRSVVVFILMVLTAISTAMVRPTDNVAVIAPDLDQYLPDAFGVWRRISLGELILPNETELEAGEAVAYRAYQDEVGRIVTLVVAYGPPMGDSVRLHRPELCYVAQGFQINGRSVASTPGPFGPIPIVHLSTDSPTREEAVTYWLRSGPGFVTDAASNQVINFKYGISQRLDGALIRVSSPGNAEFLHELHAEFLADFSQAIDGRAAEIFLGQTAAREVAS